MPRLYGDISEDHEKRFLYIKGCLGHKANGPALEEMIDRLEPQIKTEQKTRRKKA